MANNRNPCFIPHAGTSPQIGPHIRHIMECEMPRPQPIYNPAHDLYMAASITSYSHVAHTITSEGNYPKGTNQTQKSG